MAGGASSVKSFTEGFSCLCPDSMSSSIKGNYKNVGKLKMMHLSNSNLLLSAKNLSGCSRNGSSRKRQKLQGLIVVDELGGQYEDTFNDVKKVSIYIYI